MGKELQQNPRWYKGVTARFLNAQSHDLGWYEISDYKAVASDEDVKKWVETLGFDYVMLTDMFDESLVLLQHKLDLPVEKVANVHFKAASYYDPEPSAEQYKELQDLLHVDFILYDQYKQKFLNEWEHDDHSTGLDRL